jgi:hypothetical protein
MDVQRLERRRRGVGEEVSQGVARTAGGKDGNVREGTQWQAVRRS